MPSRRWNLQLIGLSAVATVAAVLGWKRAYRAGLRRLRNDHKRRRALWNRFYAHDWGDTRTNNYGFAPADGEHAERYQHQIYRELLKLLEAKRPLEGRLRLLEVSCGRAGGLNAFLAAAPPVFETTGLDIAQTAIDYCSRSYGEAHNLRFVQGDALHLPFADGSFDVVLNVEASNDYGDRPRFFREVARVIGPGGIFLYTDSFRAKVTGEMKADLAAAGFDAEFRDITGNVAEACRLDTPRRVDFLRRHTPLPVRAVFGKEISNYAGVEGSKKHGDFVSGRRCYLMTAAVKR